MYFYILIRINCIELPATSACIAQRSFFMSEAGTHTDELADDGIALHGHRTRWLNDQCKRSQFAKECLLSLQLCIIQKKLHCNYSFFSGASCILMQGETTICSVQQSVTVSCRTKKSQTAADQTQTDDDEHKQTHSHSSSTHDDERRER